jgi:hypothetical protein
MAKPAFICEACQKAFPSREIAEWHEAHDCIVALREQRQRERKAICAKLTEIQKWVMKDEWNKFVMGAETGDHPGEGWNTPEARRKRAAERKRRGLAPAPAELTGELTPELAPGRRQKSQRKQKARP